MIIYFCDRELNILGHASTTLPQGIRVRQDKTVEDVESGVNSFECILTWDAGTRFELEQGVTAGNYILKQSDTEYDSLYQIVETEIDTKAQEISLYAEDAGLDLLNTLCPATTLTNKTITQMLTTFLPNDWVLNVENAPTTTKTYAWDGTSTCTERVRSVVGLWDCELYYSFVIKGLQIQKKILNVVQKRGNQEAIPQLRLNYDIDKIVTKTSIADLVTALAVTGGTPEGSQTPINLVGYDYSYTDLETGEVFEVDKPTGQMRCITAMDRWSGEIDQDGLLLGSYSFDTTDKAVLAGQARAELQKRCYPAVNYDVDFTVLPENAKIGDRVNIIDDDGNLYLEARLLQIETCEAENTKKAVIGEYLLKTSGISDKVQALANDLAHQREADLALQEQMQVITETVDSMYTLEVDSEVVLEHAYLTARLLNGRRDVKTDFSPNWFKWVLRSENGERLLSRGYTYDVDLNIIGYASTILCKFIRPQLYDLTDHNNIAITDQNLDAIQVSFAGIYNQPVVQTRSLKSKKNALRTATVEVGDPTLNREVNLYDHGNVNSTLQRFWLKEDGEDAGAHITEVAKEDFEANPSGSNLLARTDGIAIRDGLEDLAIFGANGMRIGKETDKHIAVTNTTFSVADENGSVPFSVSTDKSLKTVTKGERSTINGAGSTNPSWVTRIYLQGLLVNNRVYFGVGTNYDNMDYTHYIDNPTSEKQYITIDGVECSVKWLDTSILQVQFQNSNNTMRYVGVRYTDQYYDTLVKVNDTVLDYELHTLVLADETGTSMGAGYCRVNTYGKIAQMTLVVYNTNTIPAGGVIYRGVLLNYLPVDSVHAIANLSSNRVIAGLISSSGDVTVYNTSGSEVSTTSSFAVWLTATYIYK